MTKKTSNNEPITYYGSRTDWETVRAFFGTFSNAVRILAELIRTNPSALRKLSDSMHKEEK